MKKSLGLDSFHRLKLNLAPTLAAALLCALPGVVHAQPVVGGAWIPIGPAPQTESGSLNVPPDNRISGAIKAFAVHPTNPDIIYLASVGGGIWRTANATAANPTWTPLTDDQPSLSMGAIEYDPTDLTYQALVASSSDTSAYGGYGGKRIGVLRTTDGGNTWTRLGESVFADEGLISVAARGAILLTGSDNAQGGGNGSGLFRSTDTGATWTLLSNGTNLPTGPVTDIIGDPLAPGRFYAGVRMSGIYRSDDYGATWVSISGTITDISSATTKIEMALHHTATDEVLYVGVLNNGALDLVWRSLAPSTAPSFTAMDSTVAHNGGQGTVHFGITTDPSDPNLVYIGGDRELATGGSNVQRGDASLAAGTQWKLIVRENANGSAPHADCRCLWIDASGSLLQGDDGGFYRLSSPTTTGTVGGPAGTWTSVIGNLACIEAHDVAYDSVAHVGMVGTQDNGVSFQSASNSLTWVQFLSGDGGDVAVDDISEPGFSYRYSSLQNNFGFSRQKYDASNVQIAWDFPPLTPLGGSPPFVGRFTTPYAVNKVVGTRLVLGSDTAVYESLDQGETCTALSPFSTVNVFYGKPIAYGGWFNGVPNPDVLYYGSGDSVKLRTTAGGLLVDTTTPSPGNDVQDIVLDNNDWHHVFATTFPAVFYSTDSGGSWADITGNLGDVGGKHALEFFQLNGADCVALAADSGVFVSFVNDLGNWQKLGTGLPAAISFDLQYSKTDNILVVGTFGRGAWTLPISSVPTVNTTPTNIVFAVNGPNLDLSWPADHTGWRLLAQTNSLVAGVSTNLNDWATVPGSAGTNLVSVPIDPAQPGGFFRLIYP